jgi:hypothetical protein
MEPFRLIENLGCESEAASLRWIFVGSLENFERLRDMEPKKSITTLHFRLRDGYCVGYIVMTNFKTLDQMRRYRVFLPGTHFYARREGVRVRAVKDFILGDGGLSMYPTKARRPRAPKPPKVRAVNRAPTYATLIRSDVQNGPILEDVPA